MRFHQYFFRQVVLLLLVFFLRFLKRPDLEYPSSVIKLTETEMNSLRLVKHPSEENPKEKFLDCLDQSDEVILIRSSRAFEEKYIDFESIEVDKKMVSLGSLVSEPKEEDIDDDCEIIQWLNGKKEASTVYVSFGSECYLTKEELKELALGLEISEVNFIWCVRSPDGEQKKLEEVLPEGFVDRIKGRGFLQEGWAPQAKILKHSSTRGFVSHCGWGSVMESITFGVPIIGVPMQYDQLLNAKLVAEMGVGLEVAKGENGWREGGEIGKTIQEVVVKDEGEGIRRKSRELAENLRVKLREDVDIAMHEIMRMCYKNQKHMFSYIFQKMLVISSFNH